MSMKTITGYVEIITFRNEENAGQRKNHDRNKKSSPHSYVDGQNVRAAFWTGGKDTPQQASLYPVLPVYPHQQRTFFPRQSHT